MIKSKQRATPSTKGTHCFQGACRGTTHQPRTIHVVVNPLNLCLSDAPLSPRSRTRAGQRRQLHTKERETTRKIGLQRDELTLPDAAALDHVAVAELHGLRTLRPQLTSHDHLSHRCTPCQPATCVPQGNLYIGHMVGWMSYSNPRPNLSVDSRGAPDAREKHLPFPVGKKHTSQYSTKRHAIRYANALREE